MWTWGEGIRRSHQLSVDPKLVEEVEFWVHLVFRTTHLTGWTCLDSHPAKTIAILPNPLDFESFNCVKEIGFKSRDVELEQKQNNQHHDNDDENGAGHDDDDDDNVDDYDQHHGGGDGESQGKVEPVGEPGKTLQQWLSEHRCNH